MSARRTLETLRRHFLLLLTLAVLCPLTGVAVTSLTTPKTYQATATIWALHQYSILTETSLDPNDLSSPAETQVTAISELIQSRSFALQVAQQANVATTLKPQVLANAQSRDDALVADIAQHVKVQSIAYSLLTITYTGSDPQVAQNVIAAVIQDYGQESQQVITPEEQTLLKNYDAELYTATVNEQKAATAETQYIQAHSTLTVSELQNDPQYEQLHAQTQLDELSVQNIESNISTLKQDIVTRTIVATNLYKVLDKPSAQPVSRLKSFLLGAGVGLAIAIIACALLISLAMGADRRIYTSADLQKVTAYPVVMELPCLSQATISMLITPSAYPEQFNGRGSM